MENRYRETRSTEVKNAMHSQPEDLLHAIDELNIYPISSRLDTEPFKKLLCRTRVERGLCKTAISLNIIPSHRFYTLVAKRFTLKGLPSTHLTRTSPV